MLVWSVSRCYHLDQRRLCAAGDLPVGVLYQLFAVTRSANSRKVYDVQGRAARVPSRSSLQLSLPVVAGGVLTPVAGTVTATEHCDENDRMRED